MGNYIVHSSTRSHKYIDKYRGKNGKWVYIYKQAKADLAPKITTGGFNEGERNRQSWKEAKFKNGVTVSTLSGSNESNKYAGVTVGKMNDSDTYVEKTKKIGALFVNYEFESGMHTLTVHVDHDAIEKGKALAQKFISKLTTTNAAAELTNNKK